MKRSILLISACLIAGFSQAQENTINSVLLDNHLTYAAPPASARLTTDEMNRMHDAYLQRMAPKHLAEKTTSTTITDWYDLWNANYNSTGTNVALGYYWAVFPDSNVKDATSTAYYIFEHGMGVSFDPTDSGFFDSTFNSGCLSSAVSLPMAQTGQSYTIDSFYIPVQYKRLDPTATIVDSLIIELEVAISNVTSTDDTGLYNLHYNAQSYYGGYAADHTPRFSVIHYNPGAPVTDRPAPYNAEPYLNDCYFDSIFVAPPYKQRFAFALSSVSAGDTVGNNGLLNLGTLYQRSMGAASPTSWYSLPINPVLLTSKEHMVSWVSFKSGHAGGTYPLGTTAANWIKLFAGSPRSSGTGSSAVTLAFAQASSNASTGYPGSYQSSQNINNQSRYDNYANTIVFPPPSPLPSHDCTIPEVAYATATSQPYDFVVGEEAFHITWTATPSLGINNVINSLNNIKAYPNPATNTLSISYTLSGAAPVSVSLTNIVGQTVATQPGLNGRAVFNVADLPAGVYLYSVIADGERSTGHVVIAH